MLCRLYSTYAALTSASRFSLSLGMSSNRPLSSARATAATTFPRLVTPLHESFTFLSDTDDCLTDYTRTSPLPTIAFL